MSKQTVKEMPKFHKYGKVIVQNYKYKPFTNFRCAGCRAILLQLANGQAFTSTLPIFHCGKIRLIWK